MVLSSQKQLEEQLNEVKRENEELQEAQKAAESEKEKLTKTVDEFQLKLSELETAVHTDAPAPWETDEELKEMSPMEIRACFENDDEEPLSDRHRVLLDEMCISQLQKELSSKSVREIALSEEINGLNKQLEASNTRLKFANAKRLMAQEVLKDNECEEDGNSSRITPRLTRSRSRASVSNSEIQPETLSGKKRKPTEDFSIYDDSENASVVSDLSISREKRQKKVLSDSNKSITKDRSKTLSKELPSNPFKGVASSIIKSSKLT